MKFEVWIFFMLKSRSLTLYLLAVVARITVNTATICTTHNT